MKMVSAIEAEEVSRMKFWSPRFLDWKDLEGGRLSTELVRLYYQQSVLAS